MDQAAKLRNIIKHQNQNQRLTGKSRVITITSGKGGVGKSNTAINLALQFSKMGKKVLILDADFGLANVEVMFGVIPEYNLSDLIYKGKSIREIISNGPEGVGFISGGSGIAKMANLENEQIKSLVYKLSELEMLADVIIIDTGAGISPSVLEFVSASPEVVLVTTPEPTSVTDSYALLKALSNYEGYNKEETKIHVLANKVSNYSEGRNLYDKLNMVVGRFLGIELSFLGGIPLDGNISKAVMKQKPISLLFPNSNATKAYEKVAHDIAQEDIGGVKGGINKFFLNLFGRKKK